VTRYRLPIAMHKTPYSEKWFTAHRTPTEADEPLNSGLSLAETLPTFTTSFILPANAPRHVVAFPFAKFVKYTD